MTKRQLTFLIGSIIILAQSVIFWNFISPFKYDQIEVETQMCTCPDAKVTKGIGYIKSITPDGLKHFHLDFSEIYIENRRTSQFDYMGKKKYILKGEIIGKRAVSEGSTYFNPVIRTDIFHEIFLFNVLSWMLRGVLIIELLVFYSIVKRLRT
jgi:hypothetical protein